LASPTGELSISKLNAEPGDGRESMMPRRRKTRTGGRDDRITAERRINERGLKRQRRLFDELRQIREPRADNDPPPF
jgi:hypothetical protein